LAGNVTEDEGHMLLFEISATLEEDVRGELTVFRGKWTRSYATNVRPDHPMGDVHLSLPLDSWDFLASAASQMTT
jgi:hypothetical protein